MQALFKASYVQIAAVVATDHIVPVEERHDMRRLLSPGTHRAAASCGP
jgi:hypothetical protein